MDEASLLLGITAWDWAALLLYLVGITVIGVWAVRRISDSEDFFMGGRRFGKAFMIFFSFGAGTSGNDAVGVSAKAFTNGVSGIWYQWLWLFATPFYWLIAPVFRRMRALTTGDYFEMRYDSSVGALYSIIGVLQLTVNMGVLLRGGSKTIEAVTGGAIPMVPAVVVMTALFVIYGVAGGLAAAIITDFIQGILTVILSFMILPFAWHAVGGMLGLREAIDNEAMFSLVAPGEIGFFYVAMFGINALVGIVTQPHTMGVCASGRNEMDGRVGFVCGNLLKRVCTIAWMLTGLCAVVYLAGKEVHPDLVYGTMARDLLPAVLPGLVGLFLAALLASIMSSCDAFMVSCSGLFTQNFYRRYFVREKPENHYVFVGRVAAFCIVCGSVFFAFQFDSVPDALEWFFRMQAIMGAAFWLGLLWRRTTVAGAWAGTLAGIVVMWLAARPVPAALSQGLLDPFIPADASNIYLPWQMVFYLVAGFGTCIVVSLMTRRVPEPQLDRMYACLRTPVQPNEPHLPPFTLPPGVIPPPPERLFKHPDLEIPKPSFVGAAGFIAIWAFVGLLIWTVFAIVG